MSLFELLRADGSIVINKKLARNIGLETALMYSELLSKYYYFEARGQLQDGWFFNSISDMEYDTCLTAYQQRKAIEILKDLNLVECELKGMPATRYFYLNLDENIIIPLLQDVKNLTTDVKNSTSDVKNLTEDVKKLHSNNTNNNTNSNNTKENKRDMGKAQNSQKTLVDIVQTKQEKKPKKKKQSHSELAEDKIEKAKSGQLNWQKVTDRDFTYYFLNRHNEIFKPIAFDRFSSVGIIRDCFIKKYDLKREEVCQYIDELLSQYKTYPDRWDSLTFNMISKNTILMSNLMKHVQQALSPSERTFEYNQFGQQEKSNTEQSEVF